MVTLQDLIDLAKKKGIPNSSPLVLVIHDHAFDAENVGWTADGELTLGYGQVCPHCATEEASV